ncbi:prolyl endopeptidase [Thermoanaerobaculum aquaticum]|uniref:prolyl oligopeptidase n=1 Tax=Thermoanaerobaculum aquaticum TaxID=1312852 RepID=A0A062XQI5_9BACT|nr:prolyl oligopeptidase family serine peptidase [Thermoanaerobaculum aquaticum]KDA53063.1 prolyl endopeptidase [Thermoanaerobaculum aquaticum]
MKRRDCLGLVLLLVVALSCRSAAVAPKKAAFSYPQTKKVAVVEDYHGVKVADPYRWLEDLDSAETKAWVEAQNRVTFAFLEQIPARQRIYRRLQELWDYEKYSVPFARGSHYFFFHNSGLQPQSVLYVTTNLRGERRVLIDPNRLSADGTVALSGVSPSFDGRFLAYSLSEAGSDWQTWKVRRVDTGEDLPDTIRWAKFTSAAWLPDASGFYYGRYDEPEPGKEKVAANYNQKLFFHKLGTPQEADTLVYARPDHPDWSFAPEVTDDGAYLVISVRVGTDRRNRIYYQDLKKPGSEVTPLLDAFDASYEFVDNQGDTFFFLTDKDAPRGRVVAVKLGNPAPEHWQTVIPEASESLQNVTRVGDFLFARYLKDVVTQVKVFTLQGELVKVLALPGLGTASGFGGDRFQKETFFSFTSFLTPGTVYRLDLATLEPEKLFEPKLAFDASRFTAQQVFVTSKDGTKVPMFLVHRKELRRNGQNPTLLYGYGGFNIAVTPSFSPRTVAWLELGGVYAVANLRGGSEYGEAWHQAGMLKNKQNVFDDFIACAQWLIANGYTSPARLAINGGSNGGLLVGAAMTQRPDLFAAAVPAVGVMDMLRFHKFTIGWAWVSEYGSADDPDMFPVLYRYSPLHNLKDGVCYPATLVTTADHDDRVVPSHSFKFAASLQEARGCDKPALIRIETRAGHGAGKPTTKQIEETTDVLAFLVKVLGMS